MRSGTKALARRCRTAACTCAVGGRDPSSVAHDSCCPNCCPGHQTPRHHHTAQLPADREAPETPTKLTSRKFKALPCAVVPVNSAPSTRSTSAASSKTPERPLSRGTAAGSAAPGAEQRPRSRGADAPGQDLARRSATCQLHRCASAPSGLFADVPAAVSRPRTPPGQESKGSRRSHTTGAARRPARRPTRGVLPGGIAPMALGGTTALVAAPPLEPEGSPQRRSHEEAWADPAASRRNLVSHEQPLAAIARPGRPAAGPRQGGLQEVLERCGFQAKAPKELPFPGEDAHVPFEVCASGHHPEEWRGDSAALHMEVGGPQEPLPLHLQLAAKQLLQEIRATGSFPSRPVGRAPVLPWRAPEVRSAAWAKRPGQGPP